MRDGLPRTAARWNTVGGRPDGRVPRASAKDIRTYGDQAERGAAMAVPSEVGSVLGSHSAGSDGSGSISRRHFKTCDSVAGWGVLERLEYVGAPSTVRLRPGGWGPDPEMSVAGHPPTRETGSLRTGLLRQPCPRRTTTAGQCRCGIAVTKVECDEPARLLRRQDV